MIVNSWSRDWRNLQFSCWNPISYSLKCHKFCEVLNIDVQGLTELRNNHNENKYQSDLFITSANSKLGTQQERKICWPGGWSCNHAFSANAGKIQRSGFIGARIVWIRLQGSICPIFFIVVYIPHKFRKESPFAHEIIEQLNALL